MNERGEALIRYRLEQADESLESAQLLLDNGKCRPSVSRSYYAMFYSVLALLIKKGLRISKHTGAISVFNREFVKKVSSTRNYHPGCSKLLICGSERIIGNSSRSLLKEPKRSRNKHPLLSMKLKTRFLRTVIRGVHKIR
jgi:hypothetical protein